MQLDGSYEFLELTQADGVVVASARQRDTGKTVQLHIFPAERSEDANQICQCIIGLPDAARRMISKFGKDGTSTYFVTDPLPLGEGIKSWIAGQMAQASKPPDLPPAAAVPAAPKTPAAIDQQPAGPGEFTRMYTREDIHGSGSKPNLPPPPAPASAPKSAGEFTRMYTAEEIHHLTSSFRQPAPESRPAPPLPPREQPPPPGRDSAPGLETFIFERSSITLPAPVISSPQPRPPAPAPPPPQHVFTKPEPIQPPAARLPIRQEAFAAPPPIFTPTQPPVPPPAAQRPAPPPALAAPVETPRAARPFAARFDWKIALLLAAALLVVVAAVIWIAG